MESFCFGAADTQRQGDKANRSQAKSFARHASILAKATRMFIHEEYRHPSGWRETDLGCDLVAGRVHV